MQRALPKHARDYVVHIIFVGIIVVFSVLLHDRGFLSGNNLMNIARQTAMISVMAVGMTFVLAAEEIDLSFGAIVGLAAILAAMTLEATNSILLSVSVALAVGAVVGLINGFFVTKVMIPSFLVTLGTGSIVLGTSRWVSRLQSIPVNNSAFTFVFGSGDIGPVPVLFLWMLVIATLGHLALKKTPFGRQVLATGGNKVSALYSGIKVKRIKLAVLTLNGMLAALAGVLALGRLHGARYILGQNELMIVIAAVIIGGTSMFGGKGSVIGSVVGALIMGVLSNGLILMGLSVDQQMIFRGFIIIVAVSTMREKSHS